MILYDKSGMFLGMGNQELYLLGYEDIEEFRNYHNDVADLFINKPGYIFKFKNFSWIDYTLHSGTPNRRVLIKTKSGREIDTPVLIHEIYLTQEVFGAKTCFGIEFTNTPFKIEAPHSTMLNSSQKTYDQPSVYEAPASFIAEDAPSSFEYEAPTVTSSFEEDYSTPISLDTVPLETNDFKLKFDSSILDETPLRLKEAKLQEPETTNFSQFSDSTLQSYTDDTYEDLREDQTLSIKKTLMDDEVASCESESLFDFSLCAETLGFDISTLANLIGEYIEELESKIKFIAASLDSEKRLAAKNETIKLKSIALHLHIMPLYTELDRLETCLSENNQEATLHTLLSVQNVISALKDSVQ